VSKPLDLDRLEKLIAARSKGPFKWDRKSGRVFQGSHLGETLIALDDTYDGSQEDCDYIEAACETLPELITEIRRLRKLIRP